MTIEFFIAPNFCVCFFFANFHYTAPSSSSPISVSSSTFCSISTELRAVPQFYCSNNLFLQQGMRSTFFFLLPVPAETVVTLHVSSSALPLFDFYRARQSSYSLHCCCDSVPIRQEQTFIGTRSYIQLKRLIGFRVSRHKTLLAFIYPQRHYSTEPRHISPRWLWVSLGFCIRS